MRGADGGTEDDRYSCVYTGAREGHEHSHVSLGYEANRALKTFLGPV